MRTSKASLAEGGFSPEALVMACNVREQVRCFTQATGKSASAAAWRHLRRQLTQGSTVEKVGYLLDHLDMPKLENLQGKDAQHILNAIFDEAVRSLNLTLLDAFAASGLWRLQQSSRAILAAAAEGVLLQLAEAYTLPLAEFPMLTTDVADAYRRVLIGLPRTIKKKSGMIPAVSAAYRPRSPSHASTWPQTHFGPSVAFRRIGAPHPSRMLANIALTSSPAAAELFEELATPMFLGLPDSLDTDVIGKPRPWVTPANARFPEELPTMFLRRHVPKWMGIDWTHESPSGHDANGVLRWSGSQMAALPTHPVMSFHWNKRPFQARVAATSRQFCHVYACPEGHDELPFGGFLYMDEDSKIVALDAITNTPTQHMLIFDHRIKKLGPGVREKLQVHAVPVTDPHLTAAGALSYVFINPRVDCGTFNAGNHGGFVYFFEDQSLDRFFPIMGTKEVADRAERVGGLRAVSITGTAPLPLYLIHTLGIQAPNAPDIRLRSLRLLDKVMRFASRKFSARPCRPVRFYRVSVPDVGTPMVLQALARAPRSETVLATGARGIVEAAWSEVFHGFACDVLVTAVTLLFLFILSRRGIWTFGKYGDNISRISVFCLALACWKKVLWIVTLASHYRRHGWPFLHNVRHWVQLCSLTCLFILLLQFTSSSTNNLMDSQAQIIAALTGLAEWMELLFCLRPLQTLRLGACALAVSHSIGDLAPFVAALLCIGLAFTHASYAITLKSFQEVFYSTMMVGGFGKVNFQTDVWGTKTLEGASVSETGMAKYQYVLFIATSFVTFIGLGSILTGIMVSSYARHAARSQELLLRERAYLACEYKAFGGFVDWLSQLFLPGGPGQASGVSRIFSLFKFMDRTEVSFQGRFTWIVREIDDSVGSSEQDDALPLKTSSECTRHTNIWEQERPLWSLTAPQRRRLSYLLDSVGEFSSAQRSSMSSVHSRSKLPVNRAPSYRSVKVVQSISSGTFTTASTPTGQAAECQDSLFSPRDEDMGAVESTPSVVTTRSNHGRHRNSQAVRKSLPRQEQEAPAQASPETPEGPVAQQLEKGAPLQEQESPALARPETAEEHVAPSQHQAAVIPTSCEAGEDLVVQSHEQGTPAPASPGDGQEQESATQWNAEVRPMMSEGGRSTRKPSVMSTRS